MMRSPVRSVYPAMRYPTETIARAERAVRCSPFNVMLFQRMQTHSVALAAIAGASGVQEHYTRARLSELAAEYHLLWLIQVGVLRREVDGQGLTDSFRLTPLGRLLVEKWEMSPEGQARPDTPANSAANSAASSAASSECQTRHNPVLWHRVHWQDHARNFFSRWLQIPIL